MKSMHGFGLCHSRGCTAGMGYHTGQGKAGVVSLPGDLNLGALRLVIYCTGGCAGGVPVLAIADMDS